MQVNKKDSQPLVSIIMSVYNDEIYLEESIKSILEQTYKNIEFVIVNDGSTDNSLKIINSYANLDNRIVIINRENKGLPTSLNEGIAIAKGEYIARMDSDDISFSKRIEIQINFLKNNLNVDILGSSVLLIDNNSKIIGRLDMPTENNEIYNTLKYKNPIIHPSVIMKKSTLIELSCYNEKLLKAQDLDLWSKAAINKKVFYNLPETLIKYRVDLDKPYATIFKGFIVSFRKAVRERSIKGCIWSLLELLRYLLIKVKLYKPKSIRKKEGS